MRKAHAANRADADTVTDKGAVTNNLGNTAVNREGLLRASRDAATATNAFGFIDDNDLRHML